MVAFENGLTFVGGSPVCEIEWFRDFIGIAFLEERGEGGGAGLDGGEGGKKERGGIV